MQAVSGVVARVLFIAQMALGALVIMSGSAWSQVATATMTFDKITLSEGDVFSASLNWTKSPGQSASIPVALSFLSSAFQYQGVSGTVCSPRDENVGGGIVIFSVVMDSSTTNCTTKILLRVRATATAGTQTISASSNGKALASSQVTIVEQGALTLSPSNGSYFYGVANERFDAQILAGGGVSQRTFSAEGLPSDLTIEPDTGAIGGTLRSSGTLSFKVTVTDGTSSLTYDYHIFSSNTQISFSPAAGSALPSGNLRVPYPETTISYTGSTEAYGFSASGLPAGLNLDPQTGTITGTPSATGTFAVKVRLVGAGDAVVAEADYTVQVDTTALKFVLADGTETLPPAFVGVEYYTGMVRAIGGTGGNVVFRANYLPNGLNINSSTGVISGTPTTSGPSYAYIIGWDDTSGVVDAFFSLSVSPAPSPVTLTPADGSALASGMVGEKYSDTSIGASGGAGTITYEAPGLPAGLSINGSNGAITGTPTANGSFNVTVTATAAISGSASATYTMEVLPAPTPITLTSADGEMLGVATVGARYTQQVTAIGGSGSYIFSAAGLPDGLDIDPATGTIDGTPEEPGTYTIVVSARDGDGRIGSLMYSLVVSEKVRPDPSFDSEVAGILNAQIQTAERFASNQISNFNDRLDSLHNEASRHAQSIRVRMGVTPSSDGDDELAYGEQRPGNDPVGAAMELPTGQQDAEAGRFQQPVRSVSGDIALWAGGFVNFGTSDSGGLDLDHTLVGVSGGVDYRFSPDFVAGFGFGYGRDTTEIGIHGTTSAGKALSAAIYGSYHPMPLYVDGLLGMSRLDFDSTRHVLATGDFATGQRDGMQVFGSLSVGHEYQQNELTLAPYGRLQASFTRLDEFSETGAGVDSLSFGSQGFAMLAGVFGIRAEAAIAMGWGVLNARGRLEYTHDFAGSSETSIGYADLGTLPYLLAVDDYMQDYLTLGLGTDTTFSNGATLSFDYRTAFGFDGSSQSHSFGVRVGSRF